MDAAGHVLFHAANLAVRATTTDATATSTSSTTSTATSSSAPKEARPPIYKVVGIILAVCSGVFIGISFVIKKVGLLKANVKYNEEAGEGYGYLKNAWWWLGMTLMIVGEICNFVAYAFTDAILVTPLGALSVVITTILSWVFLKERLSFVGWVACFLCIVGSVVITVNAPEEAAVADIQEMQHYVIAPGFLSYAGVIIAGCLFVIFWVAPRYGKKTMLVYLTVCSLIGGLSVVATQGLGAAILAQINGHSQFNQWFLYVLFVFVIATLLTEIIYLNKALNLFNAALVTPTYYVYFTSSTIVASAVLFRGFHGTATQIIDVVMGFLTICAGVVLLQLAKSSKEVPDSKVFSGDLDQIRTVAEVEEPEYEPRADTIRGGAGIIRAMSKVRTKRQADEAKRIHEERMEPIGENEHAEWDGLRRRKTVSTQHSSGSVRRQKSVRPPLGMSHFPDDISEPESEVHPGFFGRIGKRRNTIKNSQGSQGRLSPVPLEVVKVTEPQSPEGHVYDRIQQPPQFDGEEDLSYKSPLAHVQWAESPSSERARGGSQSSSLAPPKPPPHGSSSSGGNGSGTRRQFSFQNVFHRNRATADNTDESTLHHRPVSRGALSFTTTTNNNNHNSRHSSREYPTGSTTTEEERLGLVHGDSSSRMMMLPRTAEEGGREHDSSDHDWHVTSSSAGRSSSSPEQLGESSDIGRQQTREPYDDFDDDDDDDDDEMYDEPLRSPVPGDDSYSHPHSRGGGGGGGGGGPSAFV